MPALFSPLQIRTISFRNRIALAPMCQYSCSDGLANAWHLVHLGARAVGGVALVMTEAAAVEDRGRISPQDLGIWNDEQAEALAPVVRFIRAQGAVAGIQLAHAGWKASTYRPWEGHGPVSEAEGGWRDIVGPSSLPFDAGYPAPRALSTAAIREVIQAFADATQRAYQAGFEVIELHAAHGYLIHSFLSPLSNTRSDEYGGSFENRTRFAREVVAAVRARWPERLPLFMRISATDWVEQGWDIEQSVDLARQVKDLGVDLIDTSSGGIVPRAEVPVEPGYQTPFAAAIRHEADMLTGAVGLITTPEQADRIIRSGQADLIFLGRELLRNPSWPLMAARELNQELAWPNQYARARIAGPSEKAGTTRR